MKTRIVFSVFVLGAMAVFSMFYLFGSAGAATTGTVSPSVTVSSTLSLALEDGSNVEWGSKPAGTTQTGIVQARVSSNNNWTLTVASDTSYGLTGDDGNNHIASSMFKYTSAAGDPAPSGNGITTATEFSTSATNVWTDGLPIADSYVEITYNLTIPASQVPQPYSATHTYTLTQ